MVFDRLPSLEALLSKLESAVAGYQTIDELYESQDWPAVLTLAQRIIDLHPRADLPGIYGLPLALVSRGEFARLFFEGALHKLNHFEPPPSNALPEEGPIPWSSGEYLDDFVADLIASFQGSYRESLALLRTRSAQEVVNIRRRLVDLLKTPQQLEQEQSKAWFWKEWANENSDLLDQSLFGDQE